MNVVEGLNKVDCFVNDTAYDGSSVVITNGSLSWEVVMEDAHAVFMIPNMPAPAKTKYTVTLHDGDSSQAALYTRDFELGFGDSIKIGLFGADERATQGDITEVETSISAVQTALNGKITYGTTDKVDGTSALATGTIYCYY